jgi:pyruvate dehydrogenase E2 component (dihydrolipoamide acetyltransferase)
MEVVMPRLSDSMEEGVILAWLKKEGEEVTIGDELVEIETDKASMVYEADLAGVLEILVGEGETRSVGEPIANIRPEGEAVAAPGDHEGAAVEIEEESEGEPQEDAPAEATPPPPPAYSDHPSVEERIRVSPLAARLARQKEIDLSGVEGSGPYGRIIKADIDRIVRVPGPEASTGREATPSPALPGEAAKGEVTPVELSRIQQTIARRMAESKATAPHFYLRAEVDMTRAIEVREAFKTAPAGGAPVPSLNDMVVKAAALALRHHPRANSTYRDGRIEQFSRVNIGVAVSAADALIVPVIMDSDRLDLREISAESRRLADRVRAGEVTPPELAGGTFTITNLGMFGVKSFDAVINGGQAAILSVGEATERPAVRDGQIIPAVLMDIGLACDHRILYGAEAAEFLAEIKANLEEPGLLA